MLHSNAFNGSEDYLIDEEENDEEEVEEDESSDDDFQGLERSFRFYKQYCFSLALQYNNNIKVHLIVRKIW